MRAKLVSLAAMVLALLTYAAAGRAAVTIDLVTVGNPGNAGENWINPDPNSDIPDAVLGDVSYVYQIGKYEVTAGQYTEFLNSVARTDLYQLYDTRMGDTNGCGIQRTGSDGTYSYSVASNRANLPVNFVSGWNALRFANWMDNGQPTTGVQDDTTTEDGAYTLTPLHTSVVDYGTLTRNSDATWYLPSEDEWYKAAFHKNDGVTGNYWEYATQSDSVPSNAVTTPDGGNNANYGNTLGLTQVGEFENSESAYGTYDQNGNIAEWCDSVTVIWPEGPAAGTANRGLRGGDFYFGADSLPASKRSCYVMSRSSGNTGFRVASAATVLVDVTWTGAANTTWNNTSNWTPGSTPDGVAVTFDDSATGTVADIASAATPISVTFNASQNFSITGASFGIGGDATVLKQGTGTVTMSSANSYTGLTTVENGKLVLAGGAKTPVLSNAGVDVKFGKLVLDYTDSGTSPTAVDTAMKASYAGGAWAGGQFQSTTATTANTLGWKADTVNKLITVEYTLYGDANVDGSVNLSDLGFLGDNYGATSGATWAMGDFNYDGRVNLSDLGFLGDQYGGHVAGFVTAGPANPAPEPGTLVLLAMASVGLGFYGAKSAQKRQVRLSRLRSWCLHRCFFPPGRGRSGFGRSALIAYPQSLLRSRPQEYVIVK